jgi:hypothetical protein
MDAVSDLQVDQHAERLEIRLPKRPNEAVASVERLARTRLHPKCLALCAPGISLDNLPPHNWLGNTDVAAALTAPDMGPVLADVRKLEAYELLFSRSLVLVSVTRHIGCVT